MTRVASRLELHPDRLFPAEASTRAVARELYATVADRLIFSPHGHVDAGLLVRNQPFEDPTRLLVSPDHYVTRVLHSLGVSLTSLGVGAHPDHFNPREAWRLLCQNWGGVSRNPIALLARGGAGRHLRCRRATIGVHLRPHLRPDRRLADSGRVSPALPVRTVQHLGAGDDR